MRDTVGDRRFLGMLTPSSNTVLEPYTAAMLSDVPDVTAHFGHFKVTEISLKDQALGQFDTAPMLEAASLLADARVHSICWNGTSAGWMGFEQDEVLCEQITERTGVPACSAVLALNTFPSANSFRLFARIWPAVKNKKEIPLLNGRSGACSRQEATTRRFVENVFWVARAGCAWRFAARRVRCLEQRLQALFCGSHGGNRADRQASKPSIKG